MLNSTQSRHLELWHLVTQPGLREGFLNNLNPLKFLIQIIQLNGLNQNIHKQIITQIRFLEISVIKFQIFSILGILSFIFNYLRQLQMKIRSYSILLTLALLALLSFSQELQTAPSQLKKQILPKKEQQQSKQIIVNSKNEQEINQKGNKIQQQQQKADLDIPFYCGPKINQEIKGLSAKPVPAKLAAKGRQRLTPTVYGIDLFVDSVDITVSRLIMTKGFWQPGYINLIGHIVKPGFNVLNLGSQSGLQSMIMGKIIGQTGKLYIFQPYSFSNNLVTKNVELNGLKNITTIYKYGASDQKSTATIEVTYGNTGGSRIFPTDKSQPLLSLRNGHIINHKQDVLIDTVDAILPENATLDFALIDVEKMQMKALRGMKEIIKRSPKLIIMSEWQYMYNPDSDEEKTRQFFNFMFERGYKIYMYKDKGAYQDYIAECKIGEFQPVQNIETLFKISNSDIFLFPKDSELPK